MTTKTTFSFMHAPIKGSDKIEVFANNFNDSVPLSDAIAYLQKLLKDQGDIEVFAKITSIRPPGHK